MHFVFGLGQVREMPAHQNLNFACFNLAAVLSGQGAYDKNIAGAYKNLMFLSGGGTFAQHLRSLDFAFIYLPDC